MRTGGWDCSDRSCFEDLAEEAKKERYHGHLGTASRSVWWVRKAICLKYNIAKILAGLSILFYEYWYSTGQSSLETRAPGVR
jgi:hypothetical protein